jgi:hypothetical protein
MKQDWNERTAQNIHEPVENFVTSRFVFRRRKKYWEGGGGLSWAVTRLLINGNRPIPALEL